MPEDRQEQMMSGYDQSEDSLFLETSKATQLAIGEDVPVLLNQCIKSYNAMYQTRSHEVYEQDGVEFPVWIGKLTLLLEDRADVPLNTYSRVVNALQEMNCVVQLQKGSRRELGRWLLVHHPTTESFAGMQHARGRKKRVRSSNISKRLTQLYEICQQQQEQIDMLLAHLDLDPGVLAPDDVTTDKDDSNGEVESSE